MRLRRLEALDVGPVRNAVAMGIPLLLMSAQFAEVAVVDGTLPAIGATSTVAARPIDPSLDLSVWIGRDGYAVVGVVSAMVPCAKGCSAPADYDTAALGHVLRGIKDAHPEQDRIVLVPEGDVPYDVLLATMAAARGDGSLFPDVVLSGAAP